jgi:hypothetical protein
VQIRLDCRLALAHWIVDTTCRGANCGGKFTHPSRVNHCILGISVAYPEEVVPVKCIEILNI